MIPRAKLDAFLSELAEKTNHIFDEQNRNACAEIKKLKKRYSSLKDILPKVERVNVLYDVGFSEAPGNLLRKLSRFQNEGLLCKMANITYRRLLQAFACPEQTK